MNLTDIHISFVIVNYNRIDLLKNLLGSIRRSEGVLNSEIIVIDNDSTDRSAEILGHEYKEVLLIHNKTNMGFGYACNQGIKISRGKYIFLLNSDTELLPDTLLKIRENIFSQTWDEKIAIFGFRLINPNGSLQFSMGKFPSIFSTVTDIFKRPERRKVFTTGYEQMRVVDWVTGACMLIDKRVFENIGFFDENFFMYYEETDFCFRAQNGGWKTLFHPGITVLHKHPHASRKNQIPLQIQIEIRRSHLYYFRKNVNYLSFVLLFAATMIILYQKSMIFRLSKKRGSEDHRTLIRAVKKQFKLLNSPNWKTQIS